MSEPAQRDDPAGWLTVGQVSERYGLSRNRALSLVMSGLWDDFWNHDKMRPLVDADGLASWWAYQIALGTPDAPLPERPRRRRRVPSQSFIEPPASPGVYAIRGAADYIKIGSAKNIAARMRGLQTAHPVKLVLLAVLSENPDDETRFHKQWAHLRCHGEWFSPSHDLLAFLGAHRKP